MNEIITSLANPAVKELVRLRRRRSHETGADILIDGRREIERAIAASVRPRRIFYCAELLDEPGLRWVHALAKEPGAALTRVTKSVFAKITYGDRSDGVVVTASRPSLRLDDIKLGRRPLIAAVEGIGKPGNLGAIIRSADGAGVDALLVIDAPIDLYGPNVIRSSVSTVFSMQIAEASAAEALDWLRRREIQVVAADPRAEQTHTHVKLTEATAIALGSEAHGLSDIWKRAATAARVPMSGRGDSLNVSVTAAIFFYEALRQRSA